MKTPVGPSYNIEAAAGMATTAADVALDIKWWQVPFYIVGFLVVLGLIIAIPTLLSFVVDFLKAHLPTILREAVLVTVTIALGVFLYLFRCRKMNWYGICEILLGLATALYVANTVFGSFQPSEQSARSTSEFFAWCASLYVIVRGLDNFAKSLEGKPAEIVWTRIFKGRKQEAPSPLGSVEKPWETEDDLSRSIDVSENR